MPKTVIAIHGVGSGEPVETGRAVAQNLGFRAVRQTTIYADGQALWELTDEDTGDSVIEVNWEDILKPKSTATGLLRHISYVVTSMLDVAVRNTHFKFSSMFSWSYRLALLTITPGAVLYILASAAAVSIEDPLHRGLILLTLLLATVLIALWLRKLGQHFVGLLLWGMTAALIIAVFIKAFSKPIAIAADQTTIHHLIAWAASARFLGFTGVTVLLVFAIGECWVRWWGKPLDTKLAHMALLYLPFIVMNGLMSWLGLLALSYVSEYPKYESWEIQLWAAVDQSALTSLGTVEAAKLMSRKWLLVELAATVAIGVIGILAALLPCIGYLFGAGPRGTNRRGLGARNGLRWFLALTPIILTLLLVFTVCIVTNKFPYFLNKVPNEYIKILEIYRYSVLRTLPYVVWLIGPFALVLDVLGDVLFYIQPNKRHPAAIAEQCRIRLEAAINFAKRKADGSPEQKVVVLANSQGSKIAADLRDQGKVHCPLVTTGSPVNALYLRFLGVKTEANQSSENDPWVNCYRDGDYIAGPIEHGEVENILIGRGGHTGYWSDPKMREIIEATAAGLYDRRGSG